VQPASGEKVFLPSRLKAVSLSCFGQPFLTPFPQVSPDCLQKSCLLSPSGHLLPVLLQFSVSNFRAFRDRQTLSLVASDDDKSLPENCFAPRLPGLEDNRFVKGVGIYGGNASGKSTVVVALGTLARLVSDSATTTDPKAPIELIQPFAAEIVEREVPTGFSITFVTNRTLFEYRLAATRTRVWHESLRAITGGKEQLWFIREWLLTEQRYQWGPELEPESQNVATTGFQRDPKQESFTLPNALYLSTAVKLNNVVLEPIYRWFKDDLRVLQQADWSGGLQMDWSNLGFHFSVRQLIEKTPLASRIIELLRQADLGITDARVKEIPLSLDLTHLPELEGLKERFKDAKIPEVQLYHRFSGSESMPLPWLAESAGTKRLFALSGYWFDVLSKGYTIVVDELETSIHPLMVTALLRLFFGKHENKNGAQVIFTTHNPMILDLTVLRRDQVWFTDKDGKGVAHLYPLTDYESRKGESLIRGYLSGRYGAVPFIPDGLRGSFSKKD
jgi:hypothetical protein